MNKIKLLLVGAFAFVLAGSASAQKTGYIRIDDVIRLMPETQKLQGSLEKYEADSLQPRFNYTLSEFQRKDSMVNGKDSAKIPAAQRAIMRQEMQRDMQELQNWQQISQQMIQQKQDQLLEPLYSKAFAAVQQVAKENGYSYVYTRDALIVAPPADDLLPMVARKLNLTIPGQAARPASTTPAGTKKQ
jgi:outer membrane protein